MPAPVYEQHIELLLDVIRDQFGTDHAHVVKTLAQNGPMTLHELSAMVFQRSPQGVVASIATPSTAFISVPPSGLDRQTQEAARLKSIMALLTQHDVIRVDETQKTYDVRLGRGLIRGIAPLVLDCARKAYGECGVFVTSKLLEYGSLPRQALVQLVCKSCAGGQLMPAVEAAITTMLQDGTMVALEDGIMTTLESEGDGPSAKRARRDSGVAIGGLLVVALNISMILHRLRCDAMIAFIASRWDSDAAPRLVKAAMALDASRPKWQKDRVSQVDILSTTNGGADPAFHLSSSSANGGFPAQVEVSSSIPITALRDALPDVRDDAFSAALTRLSSAEGGSSGSIFSRDIGGSSMDTSSLRLHYHVIADAMHLDVCEQVVFARYGVLGVRIMKTLLKHESIEDRFLAEEVIATLSQVRETTYAMLRDGFLRQQEIPRQLQLAATSERVPKNSVFLYVMTKSMLMSCVSTFIVKALRNARIRTSVEVAKRNQRLHDKAADEGTPETDVPSCLGERTAILDRASALSDHAVRAMRAAQYALCHQFLVMDFY